MARKLSVDEETDRLVRAYKEDTGLEAVEKNDLARYAEAKGWTLPIPETPHSLLAKKLGRALGRAKRRDEVTGHPYRAFQHVRTKHGQLSLDFFYDTDEASREIMFESLSQRQDQIVDEITSQFYDVEHWNRIHPVEEPIRIITDYTLPFQINLNAPNEDDIEDTED